MPFALPAPVRTALDMLEAAGYSAYAVGGCVRDWVLGVSPNDYDICTSAAPEDMQRVFHGERTVETGIKHGTLTVLLSGMPLEITTFRVDGEYKDGRHPSSVRFTDRIEEDLSRRDFTINAMAYSPARGFVDPYGGREDCARGIIRCVGAPEKRFEEDALRILRALRFSSRLGFPIEENTAQAARQGRCQLAHISRERIAAELGGLLLGQGAGDVMAAFPEVIAAALPDFKGTDRPSLWTRTARRVDLSPARENVRWAALLLDEEEDRAAAAEKARVLLRGLKMPVKTIAAVSCLVEWGKTALEEKRLPEMLMRLGPDRLRELIALRAADREAREAGGRQEIRKEEETLRRALEKTLESGCCYTLAQLAVDGRDMAALGLTGPAIGGALNELLLRVVRGETPNERDALLAAARRIAAR